MSSPPPAEMLKLPINRSTNAPKNPARILRSIFYSFFFVQHHVGPPLGAMRFAAVAAGSALT